MGDLAVSIVTAVGYPAYQLQVDPRPTSEAERGRTRDEPMVSPNEGNEVRRDGRQGVGVPHSSVEAGKRALPDPVERRGCPCCGPDAGTTPRASNLPVCLRKAMDRVRDMALILSDEPGAFDVHARISWGAWVGDHPGLPGPEQRQLRDFPGCTTGIAILDFTLIGGSDGAQSPLLRDPAKTSPSPRSRSGNPLATGAVPPLPAPTRTSPSLSDGD